MLAPYFKRKKSALCHPVNVAQALVWSPFVGHVRVRDLEVSRVLSANALETDPKCLIKKGRRSFRVR